MTAKTKKTEDILNEAQGISCPVRRTLFYTGEFLAGPMCGRCFPCAMGSYEARVRLEKIAGAQGTPEDIMALGRIARKMQAMSMCKKGKDTARVLLEALASPAFSEHVEGRCGEKECRAFIEYRNVPENCIRCGLCQEACQSAAIIGEKQVSYKCCYLPFEIRQRRCTKCGECIKVCPTSAIEVVAIGQEAREKVKA
jgi:ferredoxin